MVVWTWTVLEGLFPFLLLLGCEHGSLFDTSPSSLPGELDWEEGLWTWDG